MKYSFYTERLLLLLCSLCPEKARFVPFDPFVQGIGTAPLLRRIRPSLGRARSKRRLPHEVESADDEAGVVRYVVKRAQGRDNEVVRSLVLAVGIAPRIVGTDKGSVDGREVTACIEICIGQVIDEIEGRIIRDEVAHELGRQEFRGCWMNGQVA